MKQLRRSVVSGLCLALLLATLIFSTATPLAAETGDNPNCYWGCCLSISGWCVWHCIICEDVPAN